MRQSPDSARTVARRGLGAIVFLCLFTLLHATFSPGPAHLAALDLDGCLRKSFAQAELQPCGKTPAATVTGADTDGHQDGDAAQSCDVASSGPRQLADLSPLAAPAPQTDGEAPAKHPVRSRQGAHLPPDAPASGPLVLRC
ncbi:hypothetical protein [Streptomyces sp. NBC_00687]|uniref:hypothetical protein n=1 Tax=Streptomyces sp. NBC_00687 TaxID=2975807 RepID=UPI00224E77CA|nr:hypothetical protein [Streptomyces sp. NBC_00687]MCX4920010.1 hypothetical protein [Streptomyces sp. NBC_00687]